MQSWINDYMDYSMSVCEAPVHFHLWSGLWTLSCACGRRLLLPHHGRPLFPNLYVILVGPSGKVQKSTSGLIGVSMLREVGADIHMDRLTRPYINDHLAEQSRRNGYAEMVLFAPELRTAINEMTLHDGILEALTNAWDCGEVYEYSTKTGGRKTARNIWVGLLLCSTREWLIVGLKHDELGGGFTARAIILWGDTPHTIMDYSPTPPAHAAASRERAVKRLQAIRALPAGEFTLEPEAQGLYNAFRKHLAEVTDVDASIQAFHNRKHTHVLRLAMLSSLCLRDDLRVTERDLYESITLLDDSERFMIAALRGLSRTKHSSRMDDILEIVRKAGGMMTLGQLNQKLHGLKRGLTPLELREVLQSMDDGGLLSVTSEQRHPGKRAATVLRTTEEVLWHRKPTEETH